MKSHQVSMQLSLSWNQKKGEPMAQKKYHRLRQITIQSEEGIRKGTESDPDSPQWSHGETKSTGFDPKVWKDLFKSDSASGRWHRGFFSFLRVSYAWCTKDLFDEYVGTTEPWDPSKNKGCRRISRRELICTSGDGIFKGMVNVKSISV